MCKATTQKSLGKRIKNSRSSWTTRRWGEWRRGGERDGEGRREEGREEDHSMNTPKQTTAAWRLPFYKNKKKKVLTGIWTHWYLAFTLSPQNCLFIAFLLLNP